MKFKDNARIIKGMCVCLYTHIYRVCTCTSHPTQGWRYIYIYPVYLRDGCVCIHTHTHTYIHTLHTHARINLNLYFVAFCTRGYRYINIYTCIFLYYSCVILEIYVYTCIYTHTYICTIL